ncbi:ABC transporter ATP-binding protein [archaeon]|nr:ABC transporter ATP-binding protein [archaeon]
MPEFIKLEGITKQFGNNVVLNNLDFSIPKEGITGIVGLSGCGKTTLLNILIGFWKANQGKIFYNGIDITKRKRVIDHLFGFATQEGAVYPHLTVKENLKYFGSMHNMGKSQIESSSNEILTLLDLKKSSEILAENLSTGMYRRLDIACSMIHNPQILIFDEPTGNLDPVLRKKILASIKKISETGTKVILTSHLLGEVEEICDELAILHNGRIVARGHPDKLKEGYSKNEVICLQTACRRYQALISIAKQFGAKNIVQKDNYLYIYTAEAGRLLSYLLSHINKTGDKVKTAEVSKPQIEEVFECATRS